MSSTTDVPEQYLQLALFTEHRDVSWSESFPKSLPPNMLPESLHSLFAARSISTALFEGVDVPPERNAESQMFLNRRQIQLPDASQTIVLNCMDGQIIAGYPLKPQLWLGLFSHGFPPLNAQDIGVLLARIALAAEILPPLHVKNTQSRLTYFWSVLQEYYNAQDTNNVTAKMMRTMKHLQSLSGVPPRTIVFPPQFSDFSPFDSTASYEPSILQALRPAQLSSRKQWWVVAACVLSNDGHVLKAESISKEHASVFAWRYRSSTHNKDGQLDYDNGILLRSLYTLGPLSLCVLTSQSETSQAPRVSPKEIDELAKRAIHVLNGVKEHLCA